MSNQSNAPTNPLALLDGYKTYAVGVVTLGVAVSEALGYAIPDGVLEALAGLGLFAIRSGMKREAENNNN